MKSSWSWPTMFAPRGRKSPMTRKGTSRMRIILPIGDSSANSSPLHGSAEQAHGAAREDVVIGETSAFFQVSPIADEQIVRRGAHNILRNPIQSSVDDWTPQAPTMGTASAMAGHCRIISSTSPGLSHWHVPIP